MFGVNKVYDFVNKVYGMNKQSLLRMDYVGFSIGKSQ